jgi:hypothetical protein
MIFLKSSLVLIPREGCIMQGSLLSSDIAVNEVSGALPKNDHRGWIKRMLQMMLL